jgi:polysaccharide biosynthesis/export protein
MIIVRLRASALAAALCGLVTLSAGCRHADTFRWVDDMGDSGPSHAKYEIHPGDVLGIRVWNQDSMSPGKVRVRADGKISVPFLGDIQAEGLSPGELGEQLEGKLKSFIVKPVVTVTLEETRPMRVPIVGEVAKPGVYDLEAGAGVLAALAAAGGMTEYAGRDSIFVLRRAQTAQDRQLRIRFTYEALIHGRGRAAAFQLQSGDLVVVE